MTPDKSFNAVVKMFLAAVIVFTISRSRNIFYECATIHLMFVTLMYMSSVAITTVLWTDMYWKSSISGMQRYINVPLCFTRKQVADKYYPSQLVTICPSLIVLLIRVPKSQESHIKGFKSLLKNQNLTAVMSVKKKNFSVSLRWAPACLSTGTHLLHIRDGGQTQPGEQSGVWELGRGKQPQYEDNIFFKT